MFTWYRAIEAVEYRERERERERANMHCPSIACTRSFCMGLTQAEGQKLVFLMKNKYYFYANLVDIIK